MRKRRTREPATAGPTRVPLRLANRTDWFMALLFACDNLLFDALLSWTASIYQELGLSMLSSAWILAGFTAAFMCARPLFGCLSRSILHEGTAALASFCVDVIGGRCSRTGFRSELTRAVMRVWYRCRVCLGNDVTA
jgi:cyanate permease